MSFLEKEIRPTSLENRVALIELWKKHLKVHTAANVSAVWGHVPQYSTLQLLTLLTKQK